MADPSEAGGRRPGPGLPSPQASALGLQMVNAGSGQAIMRCPYQAALVGNAETGIMAHGVIITLLDHTCGAAVAMALQPPRPIATVDLRVDYVRDAERELDILAYAQCYKVTPAIAFVRAVAYERDRGDPFAAAHATFILDGAASRLAPDAPAR